MGGVLGVRHRAQMVYFDKESATSRNTLLRDEAGAQVSRSGRSFPHGWIQKLGSPGLLRVVSFTIKIAIWLLS